MRFVIISDIHDNLVNLKKCLDWCIKNNIQETLCCGDVTNKETLDFLIKKFPNPIYLVEGNVEIFKKEEIDKYSVEVLKFSGKFNIWNIGGKLVGACHEPYLVDKVLEKGSCDIIFYGHTHRPWEEKKQGVRVVNPGTLGGMFSQATFAVYDTDNDKLELKILNNI
ncbi:YfcE family phosphodiesterase [bacterium]|nr:YfcE family phosphodiesterase [bacterium]